MKPLKIFLAPFAYYVRMDESYLQEEQKKGSFQKWTDNKKGMLAYQFLTFENLSKRSDDLPEVVRSIGVSCKNILCYNPFGYNMSSVGKNVVPERATASGDNILKLTFKSGTSGKLLPSDKYRTKSGEPEVTEVKFFIDDSTCNLSETIKYSDGSSKRSNYHLVSASSDLQRPEWYAIFDFDNSFELE